MNEQQWLNRIKEQNARIERLKVSLGQAEAQLDTFVNAYCRVKWKIGVGDKVYTVASDGTKYWSRVLQLKLPEADPQGKPWLAKLEPIDG
jgi:hypothetical protein